MIVQMKKHRRYWTTLLLSVTIITGLLAGCGKGGDDGSENISAKGRYVEESIELPVQEGEEVMNLAKSEAGNPVLYSWQMDGGVHRYEYRDGRWEQETLDWIGGLEGWQEIYLQAVHESGDGTQIAWGIDADMKTHVARSSDGKTGEELLIPYLSQEGEFGYPTITELEVDGKGNYWLNDLYKAKFVVIDPDSLKTIQEIGSVQATSSLQKMLFLAGSKDMAANTEEGIFTIYGPDLEEKGTFDTKQKEAVQLCNAGKNWYLVSREGIARIVPGNETSEVIMDGDMGEMGSSLNYAVGCITGGDDDFYVMYRQEKAGTVSLVHYVYDADALAVPEHTLRVFGLTENPTIQDAILTFQKAHPDVRVEFGTAGKEDGITADDIRTLNAELLSGNGADVLLLGGLPADAYIEKGILADLTDMMNDMLSEDAYLEPVLKNTVQKDGKVYGMPVRFSVPLVYGNEEAKEALDSLETLEAYVDAHPDKSIVGLAERNYIRDFLFQMYQDEIMEEDGRVNQEKLAALLTLETRIAAGARTEAFDEMEYGDMGAGTARTVLPHGMFSNPGNVAILHYPDSIATEQIAGVMDMMVPYTIMRDMNLTPDTLKDFYMPVGIVGINQSSKQKELAEEFVRYLFSPEVQEKSLDDGLPVLESALNKLKDEVDTEYARSVVVMSALNFDGEEDIEVEAVYPTAEEVADLIDRCRTLSRPVTQEFFIWDSYQAEADACLDGRTDAKTAAENIARKVDKYLSE